MSQSQPFLARVANGSLVIQILVGIILKRGISGYFSIISTQR